MKLTTLLNSSLIKLELDSENKSEVLEELVDLMVEQNKVTDRDTFLKAVMAREGICTTGIGRGIAIPHSRNSAISEVAVALGRSTSGIDFEALDDQPVNLVFLLAAPMNSGAVYLKALARLSRLLRHPDFRESLINAKSKDDILRIIEERE